MPSRAAADFYVACKKASLLVAASRAVPPGSTATVHKAICLHAALAMYVASWEAYLERLVRETQAMVADPVNQRLSASLALLSRLSEVALKNFNTPNSDNGRTLLISYTGYDPINDWVVPQLQLNGPQTRVRVDEVLKIRHSFAHGFSIPSNIAWARSGARQGVLTIASLRAVDRLFGHLVKVTDRGMAQHVHTVFGVARPW